MLKYTLKILLPVLFLFAASAQTFGQDKVIDQIVAVVGGNVILKSDIETQYLQMQAQGATSTGDMKCEILESLLEQKLLLAEAELDTTITVTDNQINQEMDRRMQYFIEHIGSEKEVEQYFHKPIIQIKADMEDAIREQLMTQQMHSKITEDVTVTPSEVRRFYKEMKPDEIPMVKEQMEYAEITVLPKISEKEDLQVKTQLRDLKKRVENGENFATLAVLYSEGPSARNGGELGYLGRGQLDPAFAAVAFNLKPGKVSKVVKSEMGYHIIQLIDRKGEKVNVRHIIIKPKVEPEELERARQHIDSIANYIRRDSISWEKATYLYSFDKDTRNNNGLVINPQTGSSKFEASQLDPAVSKVITTMKIGEISDPFLMLDPKRQRQVYTIVKLLDKTEPHKANLAEDYQLLSNMYLQKKKENVYEDWIADRVAKTYVRIDDSYVNCNFKFKNWVK
ncbi:peptidylprolyl isomerase [Prolixibacter sp. SD074]|uniref:peptidylprolyl isomerase n=1 Tax=Prolixibacter sp. SD074 TaxID=2652391 RepID=UPI0012813B9C|nr:peptidylprolyl isomerase [Prolixibacter sp. SD074]GET28093.1 peptidylprolyl isomerase [Prolixibacter sp. SD074]